MKNLIKGVQQFQNSITPTQRAHFKQLSGGQHPEALFITCSDSRVIPNMITQTRPGELFIMRNAGNIVPPYGAANGGEEATIEYAMMALEIRNIIVCGHSHCGAMHGLLHPEKLTHMRSVSKWLQHSESTRRVVEEKYPQEDKDELLLHTVKENVLMQLENLRTHPSVAAGLALGKLQLHGWVYDIETGDVLAYDLAQKKFLPLVEATESIAE